MYSEVLCFARGLYDSALGERGLNMEQAFAYTYDELSYYLNSSVLVERVRAYTALFFLAIIGGDTFSKDDPFIRDVLEELDAAYSDLGVLDLGVSEGDELLLEHIKLVVSRTGASC